SGRTTDPDYLRQLGPAVFGYAGGRDVVKREVPKVGLVDVNYIVAAGAYTRDESREAPHNLYTTTDALGRAGRSKDGAPDPLFTYSETWDGAAKRIRSAHLPYSGASDVYWHWNGGEGAGVRLHGEGPHALEGNQRGSRPPPVPGRVRRLLALERREGRVAAFARRRPARARGQRARLGHQRRDPGRHGHGQRLHGLRGESVARGRHDRFGQGVRPARRNGDPRPVGARVAPRRDHVRHQGRDRDRARPRTHLDRAPPHLGRGRARAALTGGLTCWPARARRYT